MQKRALRRKTPVTLSANAIATALSASRATQLAVRPQAATTGQSIARFDTIAAIVTAHRQEPQTFRNDKRPSSGPIDATFGQDIGTFTDHRLAESLQRLISARCMF